MATSSNHEILVATDISGQQWSATACDLQTGSSIRTFKGQAVAPGCLCLRSGHTLIGPASAKPLLQLWPLCKKDDSQQKVVCPGPVSALAVSPDGLFCVAGIGDKVYIWEMTAGNLMGVWSDSDDISRIQFTDDGSQIVVGTRSGLLKIWNFGQMVSTKGRRANEQGSRRITAHAEAITDIHVGCGGPAARVVTASTDGTCKLWDMRSGELIRTLVYESGVSAVVMDQQESHLIVGLTTGHVLVSPLYDQVSRSEVFVSKDATNTGEWLLTKHEASVTCLALSSDCRYLASGSLSGEVNVYSFELQSNSTPISLSDAVGNLLIIPSMTQSSTPVIPAPAFTLKHQMAGEDSRGDRVFNVTISDTTELPIRDFSADIAKILRLSSTLEEGKEDGKESVDSSDKVSLLEREIAHLKQVNSKLCSRLAKDIMTNDENQNT